jgi:hypothetical protein
MFSFKEGHLGRARAVFNKGTVERVWSDDDTIRRSV